MRHRILILLGALLMSVLLVLSSGPVAQAVGPNAMRTGFEDTTLARNDDGSSPRESIGFTVNFFGTNYSSLWVNNNGNLTFDNYLSTYTPFNLYTAGRVIIAPFLADVDTSAVGEPVRYQLWALGRNTVDGRPAFGATWRNVDYYSASASHTNRNHFQVILIDRSDTGAGNFDIEFNYDQIQWEAGQASGSNSSGLGGYSARAGYSNGTAANSFELPGSAVNGAFLDSNLTAGLIRRSMNSTQLGRYIFWVRAGRPIEANLAITKSDAPDPVNVGQNLTYTLTVSNSGPDTATGVTVTDTLPAGVTFVSASVPSSVLGNVVTLNLGTIANGASTSATLTVAVTPSAATSITNSATVRANEPDPVGGNNTATAVTVVIQNAPPVASAGPDQTVEQTSLQGALVTLNGAGSSDDGRIQPLTYSWTWPGGSASGVSPTVTLPLGQTTVTLTVNDGQFSAIDTVFVTVRDTTRPVLTIPANVTVEQATQAGTAVPLTATATDICDAAPVVTSNAPAIFPLGTTTVTFTARDASGNQSTASMTVTVVDTTRPVLTVPANVTVEQATRAGTAVPLTATATDICDAAPVVTSNAPAIFPLGTTTVTFTARDASGNQSTASMTVTVVDTTKPVLTVPANVTVEQATRAGTEVPLTATATDICDAAPVVTSNAPAIFPLGTTTVTFTATDRSGNVSTASMTVTVRDTTPPVLTIPANVTVEQATRAGTVVPLTATATDICDAAPLVTSNAPAIFPLGTTTVTFTATDASGNVSTASMTVTVRDTTKPVVTLGTSVLTLWPPNHNMVNVGLTLSVSDICDADPTVVLSVTQDEKVDEDTGDGNFSPDAKILRNASGKITGLELRAERKGNGDGRVYLITVRVTDASGNVTITHAAVTVAKSQSKKDTDAVAAQAAAAVTAGVPLPYDSTAGPVIGPKQ